MAPGAAGLDVLGANAAAGEARDRIALLRRALEETPGEVAGLAGALRVLDDSLQAVQDALNGDPTPGRRAEPAPPSLRDRLGRFTGGAWSSSLREPTGTQRRQYEIIAAEFGAILERLRRLVETDLERLEGDAEAAGAPWTSGRVPDWSP